MLILFSIVLSFLREMFDGRQVAGDLESSKESSQTHLINASEGYYEYFVLSISIRHGIFMFSFNVILVTQYNIATLRI